MIDATLILNVRRIREAPEDKTVLVWVPPSETDEGFWVFASWFAGPLPPEFDNDYRRSLIERHGGYWTAKRRRCRPLHRLPSHFVELQDLDLGKAA